MIVKKVISRIVASCYAFILQASGLKRIGKGKSPTLIEDEQELLAASSALAYGNQLWIN